MNLPFKYFLQSSHLSPYSSHKVIKVLKWKIRMVIYELNIFDRQIWKEGYLPYHEANNLTEEVSHSVDLSPLLPGFWERYSAQKHWGLSRWRASLQSQTSEGQWPRRWPLFQPQEVNGEFKALLRTSYLKTVFEVFCALVFLVWTQLRSHWFPERDKCSCQLHSGIMDWKRWALDLGHIFSLSFISLVCKPCPEAITWRRAFWRWWWGWSLQYC